MFIHFESGYSIFLTRSKASVHCTTIILNIDHSHDTTPLCSRPLLRGSSLRRIVFFNFINFRQTLTQIGQYFMLFSSSIIFSYYTDSQFLCSRQPNKHVKNRQKEYFGVCREYANRRKHESTAPNFGTKTNNFLDPICHLSR